MSTSYATSASPLVVACLRVTDLRPEVDLLTGSVRRDRLGVGLSAPDASALEHALRIAEAWSARVLVVAAGPRSVEPVLRDAVALGASVVRIPFGDEGNDHGLAAELAGDEQSLARAIRAALVPFGTPDLVVCGDRSVDRGTGALPAFLAHELDAAQALGLVALSPGQAGGTSARVLDAERRLDAGWREQLVVPLPAVCSVEGAGVRLRRAPLSGVLAAESAVIPTSAPPPRRPARPGRATGSVLAGATRAFTPRARVLPAPQSPDPRIRLLALTGALVAHDPPTVVGPVGAAEAADALLGFLVRHAYLEQPPDAGSPTGADGR
jgi:electron transfer flavoprotein beta subunit